MTRSCSVPNCNTGYDNNPVKNITTFSFPPDLEGRRKWLRAIHREDLKPHEITPNNSVCILHFHEQHIIRVGKKKKDAAGNWVIPDLVRPKLMKDVLPGIFKGQPSYNTTDPTVVRKDPEERRLAEIKKEEADFQKTLKDDDIENYADFLNKIKSKDLLDFEYKVYQDFTLFEIRKVSFNSAPETTHCVKIFPNMRVQGYFGTIPIEASKLKGGLNSKWELKHWTKFETLLRTLKSLTMKDFYTFEDSINLTCHFIERTLEDWRPTLNNDEDDRKKIGKLEFMLNQLKLLTLKVPRYTNSLLIWACSLFFSFPGAYVLVRNAGTLTLPHPEHLKRITGHLKSEAGLTADQVKYLTFKFKCLEEHERRVNLLLDEIYTVPTVSYKGGKITGTAANDQGATKMQSFMITSLFGKYEDIVALFPVNSTCKETLKTMTLSVLKVLTEIGFTVLTMICDNNRMNRSMYGLLCGSDDLKTSIPNPYKESEEIFLLFDNEHILKCIRNNWFNQKDEKQTLLYPHIDNHSLILSACVKHLKDVYYWEKNKIVKLAPSLSQKALFPSSFERQNVSIALRIFDEKNVVALQKYFKNDVDGTAEFITIMGNYWNIVNVRAPDTGKHLRDPFRDPIRSPDDKNLKYLEKFGTFLDKWQALQVPKELKEGQKKPNATKLTADTFISIKHTNTTLIELCKYLFQKFAPKYILLGILQTGRLERRFGCYRQLCGGNYHISSLQIFESELKKKALGLLKLKSGKYGIFKIDEMDETNDTNEAESVALEPFLICLDTSDEVHISETEEMILYFIGGYCSHSLLKYVSDCEDCCKVVVGKGTVNVDTAKMSEETRNYVLKLTRGGLKEPTPILYEIVRIVFQLFNVLISPEFEHKFLNLPNQRTALKKLCLKKLEHVVDLEEVCPKCKRTTSKILTKAVHTLSNIFMNNYCKNKNDNVRKSLKRKLATFAESDKEATSSKAGKVIGAVDLFDETEEFDDADLAEAAESAEAAYEAELANGTDEEI